MKILIGIQKNGVNLNKNMYNRIPPNSVGLNKLMSHDVPACIFI